MTVMRRANNVSMTFNNMINQAGALVGLDIKAGAGIGGVDRGMFDLIFNNFYFNMSAELEKNNWNCALKCAHLSERAEGWHLPHGFIRGVAIERHPFQEGLELLGLTLRGSYLAYDCCNPCECHCLKSICLVYVTNDIDPIELDENLKMSVIYKTASDCAVMAGRSAAEANRLMQMYRSSVNSAANVNERMQVRKKVFRGYGNFLGGFGCGGC